MSEKELLEQQIKRIITKLFKDFLIILQDIQQDSFASIADLSKQFPPSFIDKINILSLPKYSRLRKRILDGSNDTIREVCSLLEGFDISFKKEDKKD